MSSLTNVYVAFSFIATGGLLFGYVIGINSNVVTQGQLVCPDGWSGKVGSWTSYGYDQCYQLGDWEIGMLSSISLIGALVSSLICFGCADIMGRKREVQVGAALYLLGSLGAALSPMLCSTFAGLFVYGLGIGFAMHAAPIYIAEISPAEARGALVSAKEAVIVLGMFLGFASGAVFMPVQLLGWRYMVGAASCFACVMGLGACFLHESPRWLVLKAAQSGRLMTEDALIEDVRLSLKFFRGTEAAEVEGELQAILDDVKSSAQEHKAGWGETFKYPKPLIIGCGLVCLQQVTGQPSVLYYATNIFKGAGFASSAALSSTGVGFVKLLATLVSVWRVDDFGRRQLLLWGIALMAIALSILGVAFLFRSCLDPKVALGMCPEEQVTLPKPWAWSTVAALMLYVSGYQVGFGPITWLIISEIFPLRVRGAALSTAAAVNFSFNILVTVSQARLMALLTPSGIYASYLAMTVVSFLFVKNQLVETKGLTLEEIEREMTGRKGSDHQTDRLFPSAKAAQGYGSASI